MRSRIPLLVIALGCASACGGTQGQTPAAFPPVEVKTIALEPRPIPKTSEFVATIRSLRSTTVQPQVDGLVRQILVRAGDRVRAGQAIAQIDQERQQALVESLQSERGARQANLEFAQQELGRMRQLQAGGAVSRAQLDQAESAHKNAAALLAAIESQIRENEVELQYHRIAAPASGIVGDIPVREGDRVTPETVITTIDQPEGLEAYLNVPLEPAADLEPGLTVELLDRAGKVIASNPITFIAPRADDGTQSVLVKAALGRVPPGVRVMQYVRARIVWSSQPGLAVPVLAVSRIAGQPFVFVAEQNGEGFAARQKPVSLGDLVGDDYEVRGGLQAGERVIVSNLQKIGNGAPVKPS
jgi:RND family efflux transporter MFP subunit